MATNTEVRINNAIATIGFETSRSQASEGVKKAVRALGDHWAAFWVSPARMSLPDLALHGTLERYVQWYTRAWCIVPKSVRARVPSPQSLDPTFAKLATDTISQYTESASDVVTAAEDKARAMAQHVADEARALASDATMAIQSTVRTAMLFVGACVLVYAYARGRR